jgi:hypothetical protein
MSDASPRWYHFPWFRVALALFNQAADIDRISSHLDNPVCPMPFTPGTITIKFETIVIGIRDIQRFTHQVISLTNLYTSFGNTQEFASEIGSRWEEDGHVIETRCPAWLRRSSWNFNQFQQWLFILTAKHNLSRFLLDWLESEYTFIKAS